jgi:hypothetical protein
LEKLERQGPAEEVLDHPAVGVDRACRAGAALFLAQEGVEGAFPALGGVVVEGETAGGRRGGASNLELIIAILA